MPKTTHSPKKLLFLEPVTGRSREELTQAFIKQLEKHGIKVTNKRGLNGKEKKS